MSSIPKILTNKTIVKGIPSSLAAASLFKPASGAAAVMGKAVSTPSTVKLTGMKSTFTPSLDITSSVTPKGLGGPFYTLKKPVVC